MAGTSQRTFMTGIKEEAASPGGGGDTGGGRGGVHSLWDTPHPSQLLQIYWESSIDGVRQLDSGGQKPLESTEEVGTAEKRAEQGGCGCPGLGPYFLLGGRW